jgi:hypothetical protein
MCNITCKLSLVHSSTLQIWLKEQQKTIVSALVMLEQQARRFYAMAIKLYCRYNLLI